MSLFNVTLKLQFVLFDDEQHKFMLYLDDSGKMPSIKLKNGESINKVIVEKSNSFFYQCDDSILSVCKLSDVMQDGSSIDLVYNIYCYDSLGGCKSGKFVPFNKESIDLYRFAKSKGHHE